MYYIFLKLLNSIVSSETKTTCFFFKLNDKTKSIMRAKLNL